MKLVNILRNGIAGALIAAVPSLVPRQIKQDEPKTPSHNLLTVRDLEKTYAARGGAFGLSSGRVRAVTGVSLDVAKGKSLALVGESGSGKSTLMHVLGFMDTPSSGQMIFEGKDVSAIGGAERRSVLRRSTR